MPEFTGSFQYLTAEGAIVDQGDCRLQHDAQSLTIAPASGAPLAFDLGDLEGVIAEKFQIRLPLYTGRVLILRRLGRAFERAAGDLLGAYRDRAVQCLLLEDMQDTARFPGAFELATAAAICPSCGCRADGKFCPECGTRVEPANSRREQAASGEAEIRLYKTNLAVLPSASPGFQLRLADIGAVHAPPGSYEVRLEMPERCLKIKQLGKRTEEFARTLREAVDALAASSAQAIHLTFPFLDPDQVRQVAGLLPDGRSAAVSRLAAIHPRIPAALAANAVDADLKPYYEELLQRAVPGWVYAGFKLLRDQDQPRAQEAGGVEHDSEEGSPDADAEAPPTLFWFFFPLAVRPGSSEAGNLLAWEASSRSGRATYFFRIADAAQGSALGDPKRAAPLVDSAVRALNTALAMLNFRRRPIYLSDDELQQNPQYHRYAIAARRIPELRQLRAKFAGRAVHTSPQAWEEQLAAIAGTPA